MPVRLQKIISDAGAASRREAEKLITEGKVSVNGVVVTKLGTKADPQKDIITVSGRKLKTAPKRIYIMMNKPAGYVTTMKDPKGRPIVTDILKDVKERVYPVGRLDYDAAGLLIFTNDGETANKLAHPRHEVLKTYRVKINGRLDDRELAKLKSENKKLGFRAPHEIFEEKVLLNKSWIVITISEGKNRQIKRMCEDVGHPVVKLIRVCYGKLKLGMLKTGEYRYMTPQEVSYLKNI